MTYRALSKNAICYIMIFAALMVAFISCAPSFNDAGGFNDDDDDTRNNDNDSGSDPIDSVTAEYWRYSYTQGAGSDDERIHNGSTIYADIAFYNPSNKGISSLSVQLKSTSSYFTFESGSGQNSDFVDYGSLSKKTYRNCFHAGSTLNSLSYTTGDDAPFIIKVSNDCPNGVYSFTIVVKNDDTKKSKTIANAFSLTVVKVEGGQSNKSIVYYGFNYSDSVVAGSTINNNDGVIDAGEYIALDIALKNNGDVALDNVIVTLSCTSQYISVDSNRNGIHYGSIAAGKYMTCKGTQLSSAPDSDDYNTSNAFGFRILSNCPTSVITFTITVTASGGYGYTNSINIKVKGTSTTGDTLTVTFNLNGGSEFYINGEESDKVTNNKITLSNVENKTGNLSDYDAYRYGYIFKGWSLTDGGDLVTSVTRDCTLYAVFADAFRVTYDFCGGSCGDITDNAVFFYEDGTTFVITTRNSPLPTKNGYTFIGWYTAKTGGVKVTQVSSTTTLYAHYEVEDLTYVPYKIVGSNYVFTFNSDYYHDKVAAPGIRNVYFACQGNNATADFTGDAGWGVDEDYKMTKDSSTGVYTITCPVSNIETFMGNNYQYKFIIASGVDDANPSWVGYLEMNESFAEKVSVEYAEHNDNYEGEYGNFIVKELHK